MSRRLSPHGLLLVLLSSLVLLAVLVSAQASSGPASAQGGLLEIGDALTDLDLPNNAAWQGVANDGTFFYVLTSQNRSTDIRNGKENIIRKYRISDRELVATKNDAYPDTRRFSSGEVIDDKLYVAVRGASVVSTWAHVAVYDPATLSLLEDHDIGASAGYAVPEGVAWKDGHFWVAFGGASAGSGNIRVSAVLKYDSNWSEVAAYELFTLPSESGYFGAQDILWITDSEIVTNMHEGKPPGKETLDRWAWTGAGFTKVAGYEQLEDEAPHLMGQGLTELDGFLYFAARHSDRIVKAELAVTVKPTSTETPTPTPTATSTPAGSPTPCPDFDGDTICDLVDLDDDNDGCTDAAELQTAAGSQSSGGLRDPLFFWDFVDQWIGGGKDKAIVVGDIGAMVARFGTSRGSTPSEAEALAEALTPPVDMTSYHASADRGPGLAGPNAWNLTPPDGTITIGDIGAIVAQFGHSCATP